MADVFISYKREDRPFAERLSIVLEQLGFEVWWDFDLLSGDRYRSVIRAVIDECKVAIVLWSKRAVQSDFVMDEAEYAKAKGKLCPARIDDVDLPFGFGGTHTDDLRSWDGELFHPQFQNLVKAVEKRVGRQGRLGGSARPAQAQAAAAELEAFKAAQVADNVSALRTFLGSYPRGAFAGFVRGQLEQMEDTPRRERARSGASRARNAGRTTAGGAQVAERAEARDKPRRTTIGFRGAERFRRLSTVASWERAIRDGELAPNSFVEVTRGDAVETRRARDVPEFATRFPATPKARRPQRRPEPKVEPPRPIAEARPEASPTVVEAPRQPIPVASVVAPSPTARPPYAPTSPAKPSGTGRGLLILGAILAAIVGVGVLATYHPAPANSDVSSAPAGMDTFVTWTAASDGDPKTYTIGDMTLVLSSRKQSDGQVTPVLNVTEGGVSFEEVGEPTSNAVTASFGVGRFDPDSQANEVLFTSVNGGTNRTAVKLLEPVNGGWKELDVGSFQSVAADFPTDITQSGVLDIAEPDDRFAALAKDHWPPRVFVVEGGAIVDASSETRFGAVFRTDTAAAEQRCAQHDNGACAIFVADASRLGLYPWAWRVMLADYDQTAAVPIGCLVEPVNDTCPADSQKRSADFPDFLGWFLNDTGFVSTAQEQAIVGTDKDVPAFDCAAKLTPSVKLICNTPELAAADNSISAAFKDAAQRPGADALAVANDQGAFVARLHQAPADVAILKAMYDQEAATLQPPPPPATQ